MGQLELNRRGRRALALEGVGHISRLKTGEPAHIRAWKAEAAAKNGSWKDRKAVKKHLRNMTLIWLAEALDGLGGSENLALGRTLRKLAPTYANVLVLSEETDAANLLAVPTVGKRGVEKLEEYLRSKNVPLAWTVKRGN